MSRHLARVQPSPPARPPEPSPEHEAGISPAAAPGTTPLFGRFRRDSLRTKLIIITAVVSVSALSVSSLGLGIYEYVSVRNATVRNLSSLAGVIGSNCSAALAFSDQEAAREILSALEGEPGVRQAVVYLADGHALASYPSRLPETPRRWGTASGEEQLIRGLRIRLSTPVLLDREIIGRLEIEGYMHELLPWLGRYAIVVALFVLLATIFSVYLSLR